MGVASRLRHQVGSSWTHPEAGLTPERPRALTATSAGNPGDSARCIPDSIAYAAAWKGSGLRYIFAYRRPMVAGTNWG